MNSKHWHIIELESTDSTNDEARQAAEKHDGLVVVRSDMQTAGRGQYGRQWVSPSGKNLLATYSIPCAMITVPHLLSLNTGAAVQDLLCEYGLSVCCKWPNDVLVSGYKIAGILVEQNADRFHIGIGVNCNWPDSRTKTEKEKKITGIMAETGVQVDIGKLCTDICKALSLCMTMPPDEIITRYRNAWNDAGKTVNVYTGNMWCKGTLRDIMTNGTLSVITENNEEITIVSSAHITMDIE